MVPGSDVFVRADRWNAHFSVALLLCLASVQGTIQEIRTHETIKYLRADR